MKKIKYLILLIIPFLFFSSCKKNKEPEKQEKHLTEIIVEPLQDLSIGETSQLKITKIPEDAIEDITITVSDNNLISIENNIITALKDGNVIITVSSSNNISQSFICLFKCLSLIPFSFKSFNSLYNFSSR